MFFTSHEGQKIFCFIKYLICHWVSVDLTHVLASILFLDISDVQAEGGDKVAADLNPVVVGDDVVVDGLNGLAVSLDPANLEGAQVLDVASEGGIPADGNGDVFNLRRELGAGS